MATNVKARHQVHNKGIERPAVRLAAEAPAAPARTAMERASNPAGIQQTERPGVGGPRRRGHSATASHPNSIPRAITVQYGCAKLRGDNAPPYRYRQHHQGRNLPEGVARRLAPHAPHAGGEQTHRQS